MRRLNRRNKIILTVLEACSVFLTVFLNQMISTVFPAYPSVKSMMTNDSKVTFQGLLNCSMDNPSNVYVAVIIGSKYCTELIMLPIVGWFADKHSPPLILFYGALVEALACILYSVSGNFYATVVARVIDAIGYSIVSTSGLTLIYTIYLKEKSRNKVITIDSILVYMAAAISPFIAGSIFETVAVINQHAARVATFMIICPLFLALAIAIVPFAFDNSPCAILMRTNGDEIQSLEKKPDATDQTVLDQLNPKIVDEQEDLPPEYADDQSMDSHTSNQRPSDGNSVKIKESLNIITLLRDPHVLIVLFCLLFNSLIGNSLETTLPIFMIRKFCSDQKQQGVVWVFGFLSLLGFFLSSLLYHYRARLCWAVPIVGLVSNGSLCVCLFYCQPWWAIGVCLGIMFFFSSMTEVLLIPLIPKIIDIKYSKMYGSGSGLTLITFTISGIIGSFPVGPLVERWGFLVLCTMLCVFNCGMAPFVYFLRTYFK